MDDLPLKRCQGYSHKDKHYSKATIKIKIIYDKPGTFFTLYVHFHVIMLEVYFLLHYTRLLQVSYFLLIYSLTYLFVN